MERWHEKDFWVSFVNLPSVLRLRELKAEAIGQLVAFSEGGEAAQPFQPEGKPVDAYISALIDQIDRPNQTES